MPLTKEKLRDQITAGDYNDVLPSGGLTEAEVNALIASAIATARLVENPVGKILMTTVNVNPGTYIAGSTWVAWGSGRVPVGVDAAQTEFDTAEETGGEKTHTLSESEMPMSARLISVKTNDGRAERIQDNVAYIANGSWGWSGSGQNLEGATLFSGSSAGGFGGAHNNLQPFITCYMWKRTA